MFIRKRYTIKDMFLWSRGEVFIFFILAVIPEFSRIGNLFVESYPIISNWFVWGAIPFIMIVSWIFHTMQLIGTVGENPFEGSANDVPISTISRGIEIDLREMLEEDKDEIPKSFPALYNVQM